MKASRERGASGHSILRDTAGNNDVRVKVQEKTQPPGNPPGGRNCFSDANYLCALWHWPHELVMAPSDLLTSLAFLSSVALYTAFVFS